MFEARRGYEITWSLLEAAVSCVSWVLVTEPRSSVRAVTPLTTEPFLQPLSPFYIFHDGPGLPTVKMDLPTQMT